MGNLKSYFCGLNNETEDSNTVHPSETKPDASIVPTTQTLPNKHTLILAMDVGSAFSGYAYAINEKGTWSTYLNAEWVNEFGTSSLKTPTCILTDRKTNRLLKFGYEALNSYTRSKDAPQKFALYRNWKNILINGEGETMVKSVNGRSEMRLTDLYAMTYDFFYKHTREKLFRSHHIRIEDCEIKWMLPIPDILVEDRRSILENALRTAFQIDVEMMSFPMEHDVVSLWCQQRELNTWNNACTTLTSGRTYLIVDCGGGHITIGAYKNIRENFEPHTKVGDAVTISLDFEGAFDKALEKLLPEKYLPKYKINYTQHWMYILIQFELIKRSYIYKGNNSMSLTVPISFGKYYEKNSNTFGKHQDVKYVDGMLELNVPAVNFIFESTITESIDKVLCVLRNISQQTDFVFVVGGSSEYIGPPLRERLRAEYEGIAVIIPEYADSCVLGGAIEYRLWQMRN